MKLAFKRSRKHPWACKESIFRQFAEMQEDTRSLTSRKHNPLAQKCFDVVHCFAARILARCGVRNINDAADEVTECWFFSMLESGFSAWDRDLPFFPFGYQALRFHCYAYLRRRKFCEPLDDATIVGGSSPLESILRRESSDRLTAALNSLPIQIREAIVLRYLLELSAEEAACRLGVTPKKIFRLCARGKTLLKQRLSVERDDE